jgi:hypothetical protein
MSQTGLPARKLALALVLALMLGTALASGFFVRASLDGVVTQIPESFKACKADSDCTSVQTAGCSCAASGQYDEVAKVYAERFTRSDQCTKAELAECATAGKRRPATAVCLMGMCTNLAEAAAP